MTRWGLAPLAAGLALLAAPAWAQGAAKPGVVAGTVAGSLPAKGAGEVDLHVLALADGRLAAARTLGRRGTFSLTLPAGGYALRTTVVTEQGRAPATTVTAVSVRAGQRRRGVAVKVRRAAARRAGARAAYLQESGTSTAAAAVAIEPFAGATGDRAVLNRGLTAMLHTDVSAGLKGCRAILVANSEDRKVVEAELDLQRSRYFDPKTRVARNLIQPDLLVTGTLVNAPGGAVSYEIQLRDVVTGENVDAFTGTLGGSDPLAGVAAIGRALARSICRQPRAYELRLRAEATGAFVTFEARGTATGVLIARAQDGDEDTPPTRWRAEPSEIAWENLTFASALPCTWAPALLTGQWGAEIRANGDGRITVVTQGLPTARVESAATCPPAPPLPNQGGPALGGIAPEQFVLPARGGTQPVGGALVQWTSSGTITVRPSIEPR